MSKQKHSGEEFTNEHTIRRRAWIARAIEGVRGRFDTGEDDTSVEAPEAGESPKPHLYVVKPDDVR